MAARGYGQSDRDVWLIEEVFAGAHHLVFVEAGAGNGIELSNTYLMEKEYGWTGLCVEPGPEFAQLIKNRSCQCDNRGLAGTASVRTFRSVSGEAHLLSGIADRLTTKHAQEIIRQCATGQSGVQDVQIECVTLNMMLNEHGLRHVDLCCLDLEGAEEEVLEAWDPSLTDVGLFLVEMSRPRTSYVLARKGFTARCLRGGDMLFEPVHRRAK